MTDTTRPPRPVPLRVAHQNIPTELKQIPQWVVWQYEFRDEKWTKPPYQTNGNSAKTNDSSTWTSFRAALDRYGKGDVDGIGIALSLDMGIVGVDLDHCYDPQEKKFKPWATKIIEQFNSYTELSPSGMGVRIFVKGKLPAGGRKADNIEIYSSGRYLTTTGRKL